MGLSESGFKALIAEIESQGFDNDTAGRYAGLMGDTPCYDEAGKLLVIEAGKVIATLKPLDFFKDAWVGYSVQDAYGQGVPKPPDCIAKVAHLPEAQVKRLLDEGRFDYAVLQRGQHIANIYDKRFGNFEEIALPEILFEKQFEDLLLQAINNGSALTAAQVQSKIQANS